MSPSLQRYYLLVVSCLAWCVMQSCNSFPLKVPLLPLCSIQIERALVGNAYMQILREHPAHCTILGTFPQASVTYRQQQCQH